MVGDLGEVEEVIRELRALSRRSPFPKRSSTELGSL